MPWRRVVHIGGVIALLCVAAFASAPGAHADAIPCGLLSSCPAPPVSSPPSSTPAPTSPAAPGKLTVTFDGHAGLRRAAEVQLQNSTVIRSEVAFLQGRCSDGSAYESEVNAKLSHPAPVTAKGTAAYTSTYAKAYTYNKQGKRVNGRETVAVRLSDISSNSAGVTFHDTFRSGRFSCDSGTLTVAAYPQGSPRAPFEDSQVRSGVYGGTDTIAGHRHPFVVDAYLPWGLVGEVKLVFADDCGGHVGTGSSDLGPLALHVGSGGDTFSTQERGRVHYRNGITARYTLSLRGQFNADRIVSVAFTSKEDDYRGRRYEGSCTGSAALSGTYEHG